MSGIDSYYPDTWLIMNRASQACAEMFQAFANNTKEVANTRLMSTIDFLKLAKALKLYPVRL